MLLPRTRWDYALAHSLTWDLSTSNMRSAPSGARRAGSYGRRPDISFLFGFFFGSFALVLVWRLAWILGVVGGSLNRRAGVRSCLLFIFLEVVFL